MNILPTATQFVHQILNKQIQPNDILIDATMGNGNDTLLLAKLTGTTGHLYAFDIQPQALTNTAKLLASHNAQSQTSLIQASHHQMKTHILPIYHGKIKAITFNLGYLPNTDKTITTQATTTHQALQQAINLIAPQGLITIITYSGHPNGKQEHNQVQNWATNLANNQYQVITYQAINRKTPPPTLFIIEKIK